MNFEKFFQILGMLVGVATIAVVLQSPQTASVIRATGAAFTGAVKASMGSVGR